MIDGLLKLISKLGNNPTMLNRVITAGLVIYIIVVSVVVYLFAGFSQPIMGQ